MHLASQIIFFSAISIIFIATILSIKKSFLPNNKDKHEKPKYVGATEAEVEELLDELYIESCFWPFDERAYDASRFNN